MNIDDVIKISEFLNAPTILMVGYMFWQLKKHQDKKFDKIDVEFKTIHNELIEIRKGVNRLEGTVYGVQSFRLDEDHKHDKRRNR